MQNEDLQASVIIPTRNRADMLRLFLPTLADQDTPARFEIIVVDNGSSDDTERVVSELSKQWPLLRVVREERQGAATARNTGARNANSRILVFVDDDMRAAPDLISKHLEAHAENPGVCVLGNVITEESRHPFERMLGYIYDGVKQTLPDREPTAFDFWSGNVSLEKELFDRFSGYNEAFDEIGYAEDLDFGRRLLDAGVQLRFVPEAVTYHNFRERFGERLRKSYRTGVACGYVKENFPDVPIPNSVNGAAGIGALVTERFCHFAAVMMEPFDRGKGIPMKPLAYVYDLGIRMATSRGFAKHVKSRGTGSNANGSKR